MSEDGKFCIDRRQAMIAATFFLIGVVASQFIETEHAAAPRVLVAGTEMPPSLAGGTAKSLSPAIAQNVGLIEPYWREFAAARDYYELLDADFLTLKHSRDQAERQTYKNHPIVQRFDRARQMLETVLWSVIDATPKSRTDLDAQVWCMQIFEQVPNVEPLKRRVDA